MARIASWAEHGRRIKGSNQTWLVAFGKDIQHLGEMEGGRTIYTKQVAPSIASILKVPFTNGDFTMFAALLADEAFLAISCVLLYFLVPSHLLFSLADGVGISADATNEWIKGGVQVIFIISTLIVAVWTAILYLLLLHRPQILGWVLKGCCKIPFLRKFLPKVEKFSEEMTMASKEAKLEGGRFWLQLMGYTSLAWLSRFAIVVAILVAFHCQGNMLVAWCRQWVMWMISILSPTPGGSGVAELMFRLYYADFLPDASVAILAAMLWRAIFYYPFLVMGTLVLPKWIARN